MLGGGKIGAAPQEKEDPMKRVACVIAAVLLLVSLAGAATNLNSSKSNAYRMTYSKVILTPAQAEAVLAELDKTPQMDEAAIKQALPGLLKKNGVDAAKVKKTIVKRDSQSKSISIILLDNPADESAAVAADDESAPRVQKGGKGKMPPYGRAVSPSPRPSPRS
jgi:hypothetical protein